MSKTSISITEANSNPALDINKTSSLENLKHTIKEIGISSTSHGIPNIIRSDNIIVKCMWIIFFLLSTGLCFYMIIMSIIEYLKFDAITQIDILQDYPTIFPTIIICSINPLTTNYSQDYAKDILSSYGIDDIINSSKLATIQPSNMNQVYANIYQAQSIVLLNAKSDHLKNENKKKLGFPLEDMLIRCWFNSQDCSEADFEWFYDYTYGNCYKFNSGKNLTGHKIPLKSSVQPGKFFGLQLELFVGNSDNTQSLINQNGIRTAVIDYTENYPNTNDGMYAPTGFETNLILNKQDIEFLDGQYSDCIKDLSSSSSFKFNRSFYDVLSSLNVSYQQRRCIELCYQEVAIQNCSCNDLTYNNLPTSSTPCLSFDQLSCLFPVFVNYFNNDLPQDCFEKCPRECKSTKYFASSFLADFPSQFYAQALIKNSNISNRFKKYNLINGTETLSTEFLKKNILALNVYYENFKYTKISQQPSLSLIDLFANFGGTLGLFVGISVLSFVEIFEILLQIIIYKFKEISKSKKMNS